MLVRKYLLRITVYVIALTCGLLASSARSYLQDPQHGGTEVPCLASTQRTPIAEELIEYPDNLGLEPMTIARFINANPRMSFTRLWNRLHLKDADQQLTFCRMCQAYMVLGENEAILRLGSGHGDRWMFLVFTWSSQISNWSFVDVISIFDRYNAPEPVFVVSDERPYLIIPELAAYGSGLGLYHKKIFGLEKGIIREVSGFLGNGSISGEQGYAPSLSFDTRFISLEVFGEKVVTTIEYTFHWSYFGLPLVSKISTVKLSSHARPGMNQYGPESDYESSAYRFLSSMTGDDFLKYNLSELHELATQGTRDQKRWLENYLRSRDSSKEKRQLLAALAN